jgi:hypothetical protein
VLLSFFVTSLLPVSVVRRAVPAALPYSSCWYAAPPASIGSVCALIVVITACKRGFGSVLCERRKGGGEAVKIVLWVRDHWASLLV